MRKALGLAGTIAVVATLGALDAAEAMPLDLAACSNLNQERSTLETSGVLNDLQMTSADAKALAKDRLLRIQRYVEISGQILFRCTVAAKTDDAADNSPTQDTTRKPIPPEPGGATSKKGPGKKQRP